MRLALVLLIGLAALTDAFTTLITPLEAHSTTTEKTPNSGNNYKKYWSGPLHLMRLWELDVPTWINLCIIYVAVLLTCLSLTLFPTDEMESWQLRFQNGTTVTGAGMPPALWVKQPVQEKLETKGSIDNLKGLRQFGWPPPISPGLPGNPGIPQEGLRQLSPPIHPDLPGNTEGRGKGA